MTVITCAIRKWLHRLLRQAGNLHHMALCVFATNVRHKDGTSLQVSACAIMKLLSMSTYLRIIFHSSRDDARLAWGQHSKMP